MTTNEKRLLAIILCLLPAIGILTGIVITQNRLTGEINQTPELNVTQTPVENQTKTREVNKTSNLQQEVQPKKPPREEVEPRPKTPKRLTEGQAFDIMSREIRRRGGRVFTLNAPTLLGQDNKIYHASIFCGYGDRVGFIQITSDTGKPHAGGWILDGKEVIIG